MSNLVPVIGIEVHVAPKTESKMFCDCSADHFGAKPNIHVCPVCLGMPGALPVPNKAALEKLVTLGKALSCKINNYSYFERKSYFYPDLPKGYQISQYRLPLCVSGQLPLPSGRLIRINRAHMEEDTAKMKHKGSSSFVDFNRSGVPLIEIVSEADISSAAEAKEYLKQLARLIRWLDISDASMEKGTMRLEANVSIQQEGNFKVGDSTVKPAGSSKLNPRVELKNINSYRFVEKAVDYEIKRQTKLIELGINLVQETRGWDEAGRRTFVQRTKETSSDYRYFPEPDIPPIMGGELSAENKPILLPWEVDKILREKYNLSDQYIRIFGATKDRYGFFKLCMAKSGGKLLPELLARVFADDKVELTEDLAQHVVNEFLKSQKEMMMDDKGVEKIAFSTIKNNPEIVADYKGGKESALNGLIGPAMRSLKGRGNARLIKKKLKQLLDS